MYVHPSEQHGGATQFGRGDSVGLETVGHVFEAVVGGFSVGLAVAFPVGVTLHTNGFSWLPSLLYHCPVWTFIAT